MFRSAVTGTEDELSEHDNEASGSIKAQELYYLSDY
jgi:hypothetical protein